MKEIQSKLIENAVYNMCKQANICLPLKVYSKIKDAAKHDVANEYILKNAEIAYNRERPLCQDTGQVIVFVNIGQDVIIKGNSIKNAINNGVARCYKENYFRKSVVKNTILDRTNTQDNTPAIIHYDIIDSDEIELKIMIKGGGSENVTCLKMLNPTIDKSQLYQEILETIQNAGTNACPPIFVGIGYGQSAENAILLSKKAIIEGTEDNQLCDFLNKNINIGLKHPVLEVATLSNSTHIACMPVGITILCHSNRYHSCKIKKDKIIYTTPMALPDKIFINPEGEKISCNNLCGKKLPTKGKKLLLCGKIYTARDQAHKKLVQMIEEGKELPFELKNSIIFYAGPCPATPDEISGPIGPTTAKRMDDFAITLYKHGVIATIGKGTRSKAIFEYLKSSGKKYFEMQGGIASYISNCIKSSNVAAFEDLGAEAVYELEVENLPVICVE